MFALAAVCIGSFLTLLQISALFILSDLRERVMRLETAAMDEADRERRRNRFSPVAGD
jgi:hypothetical protein